MTIAITKKSLTALGFIALSAVILVTLLSQPRFVNATAPAGTNAQVATSSLLVVGPQSNVATGFGTTTSGTVREQNYTCSARVISTVGQPINISFASLSSTSLSQTTGFQQAASTTVTYDGGLYGCGYMTIRGQNASTTISIMETR